MGNSQSAPDTKQNPDACPVDHKTRQAWLDKAKAQTQTQEQVQKEPEQKSQQSTSSIPPLPVNSTCDSSAMDQSAPEPSRTSKILQSMGLSTQREISTIPRVPPGTEDLAPKNSEQTASIEEYKKQTNWIYPSPKMFFDAMKRKNMEPEPAVMENIVPIHNAVNERVWVEIKEWEKQWGTDQCEGPFGGTFLESFHGMGDKLSPKARFNTMLGYQAPFDRHEWVINRCGRRVEYLIDFYAGRDERVPGKSLNFYLDVRPKLNNWEGWAMRGARIAGLKFNKDT